MRQLIAWSAFGLVVSVALARASTAAAPPQQPRATDAQMCHAFEDLLMGERQMRLDAAKDYPTDAWSQDDAFHNLENERSRAVTGELNVALGDVLYAADLGMHGGCGIHFPLKTGVVPCRPRPIY